MKFKLVALFAVLVLVALSAATAENSDTPYNSTNPLVCEPVVTFDVSGSTLLGPCHKHLSVYNNGRVSLAEFAPSEPPRNESKMISVFEVRRLVRHLGNCKRLRDDRTIVMDVPMTTVTVFQQFGGFTDSRAHSFSYWLPIGDYAEVQQIFDEFIRETFTELPRHRDAVPYE